MDEMDKKNKDKIMISLSVKKKLNEDEYVIDNEYRLETPKFFRKKIEEKITEEEKRLSSLQSEIENLNKEIERKKEELSKLEENIIEEANEKAAKIIDEAEKVAFNKVKSSLEEKNLNIKEGEKEKERIIEEAKREANRIIQEAMAEAERIKKEAYEKGFDKGVEDGFNAGKNEIVLLSNRLKEITSYIVNKRNEIVNKSEREVVELALEVVRKVLKEIRENEKDIVVRQIKYVLSKLSGSTKFIVRVNPADIDIVSRHKEEFIKMIEQGSDVKIFEDHFVEQGGVIVETDTTTIDAQITSQLLEIEEKIKTLLP
ncbi:MAG: flagellar assembly protein FliH [Spirochaetia bacterium]|nr:flagellar assembly protein FliH [Spirochaetota bacterium]MDW8112503.1 flagellar assembly protein FliH [Spirochaetia bacterium]